MKIYIGENIKRLRKVKNITQETLAEHLNISIPAVCKWERGETLPDIAMILPLANYFGVTTDELLGYDNAKNEKDIKEGLEKYDKLQSSLNLHEADELIEKLRNEYPNDFSVAIKFMYHMIGGSADNSDEILLNYADEFIPLCERILNECAVNNLRSDASVILAKIYNAQGENEKALECFESFPDWYSCKGQKCEQLYEKGTAEW